MAALDGIDSTCVRVSVLVPSQSEERHIARCLDSLAAQTLDHRCYEVVVVDNGGLYGTERHVREARQRHQDLVVRQLIVTAGSGNARNLAVAAARGEHLTFVDPDDAVSPRFLETLLAAASPGAVPVTLVGEIEEGDTSESAPTFDNYYSSRLAPYAGRRTKVAQVPVTLSTNIAKLVPRALAQRAQYDGAVRSGDDVGYWLELFDQQPFEIRVVPATDAYYIRTVPSSVARNEPSWDAAVVEALDCVPHLLAPGGGEPDAESIAGSLLAAQCERIHDYLCAHPEDQSRVIDEVHRRRLTHVAWPQINRGRARDLAILYCFPPFLDTSGMVAARRLRERGTVTDVISADIGDARPKDLRSLRVPAEVIDTTRVLPGPAAFATWSGVRTFVEQTLEVVAQWQAEKGPYHSVYSRAMAVNSHFAAAVVKLRNPDIRWTAEFSDPLRRNPQGEDRANDMEADWLHAELRNGLASAGFVQPDDAVALFEWAELIAYALADEIVFTNELQRDFMLGYCRDRGLAARALQHAQVAHHPTLPAYFYDLAEVGADLDPETVNIGYFGVFYATRGLTEVVAAVNELPMRDRERLRLYVFTDRHEALSLEMLREGLADVIVVRPYVPYLEFLKLTTLLDVLLVNDASTTAHHGVNPYLPSKVSDYLGSGTPIWAIHEPGSVLSGIETTYSSALHDVAGARAVLEGLAREHRRADVSA